MVKISETFHPAVNDGYALIDSVETGGGKQLLHPMKILLPEGSVTAILGPSGAGKSTLLSVLTDSLSMFAKGKATGMHIYFLFSSLELKYTRRVLMRFSPSSCLQVHLPGASTFVPQDDRLHGFFTVKSYMKHYARLSGLKLPPKELEAKIDGLISQLGLDEQKGTIVGDLFLKGLSGGQKRRLSICLEALTDPCNFFLDEPTSGLGTLIFNTMDSTVYRVAAH
jgi:ABC-type multidrug transport system ATPase subunit